jgi:GTP-binding protein
MREAEGNVAIRVTVTADGAGYEFAGRGELQLGVLIETMRREGYEMSISRPRVVYREDPDTGKRLEPIEEVVIDVDEAYSGVVVEKLSARRSELMEMRPSGGGKQRLVFHAPSRALIGYHGEFLTATRGTGVMHRLFHGYAPDRGAIEGRRQGVIISTAQGISVAYALWNLEERGPLFIGPGERIYAGMLFGEHNKGQDIEANPLKTKQLTNIRASGSDDAILLTPPVRFTLERAIAYIDDDELVEVTPRSIRLRKKYLDPHERKRHARQMAASA